MPSRQVTRVSTSIPNSGPRFSSRLVPRPRNRRLRDSQSAAGAGGRKPGSPELTALCSAPRAAGQGPTSRRTPGTCPPPARLLRLSVPGRGRFRTAARPRPAPAAPHLRPPPGTAAPQGAEPPTAAALCDPPRVHRRPPAPRRLPSPALPLPPALASCPQCPVQWEERCPAPASPRDRSGTAGRRLRPSPPPTRLTPLAAGPGAAPGPGPAPRPRPVPPAPQRRAGLRHVTAPGAPIGCGCRAT